MAYILKKGVWRPTQIPNFPVEIDWQHPLARGLAVFTMPGSLSGFTNLVPQKGFINNDGTALQMGNAWTPSAGIARRATQVGPGNRPTNIR